MKLFYCEDCGNVTVSQTLGNTPVYDAPTNAEKQVRWCTALRTSYATTDEGAAEACGGRLHHVRPEMLTP